MRYICFECGDKLFDANEKAMSEICHRLDDGENVVDLCVEYANERHKLLYNGSGNTEQYYIADAAMKICLKEQPEEIWVGEDHLASCWVNIREMYKEQEGAAS